MTEAAERQSATPAKWLNVREALGLAVAWLRARWYLRGAKLEGRVYAKGPVHLDARGEVTLANRVFFLGGMVRSEVVCGPGAKIEIGEGTGFNYGVSIVAHERILIGARCNFGSMVRVRDDDLVRRAPVEIGDDVWVAHGALIEPGVKVGNGAIIAAGAVVVGDVRAGTLAVGNPARCLPLPRTRAHDP